MKLFSLYILALFWGLSTSAQVGFNFLEPNLKEVSLRFQEVNNLIVIPIDINGKQLTFILDTGINKTILFNLLESDSLRLNDVKKISLQGLGSGPPVEALVSNSNTIGIKNYLSTKEEIYVILKDQFDISSRMGVTIHGIIGYTIFKNAIVKIDYRRKKVIFYNPKFYKVKKCRTCEVFPIQFYRNKPYIDTTVQLDTVNSVQTPVKLLIDTGGSETIWLFENSKNEILTPKRYFRDVLGEGLSGTIYGNKSRIKKISLGRYHIIEPTVSFLDTVSTFNARKFKERNGSIGGNILKRFKIWVDYPNKQITFKKNGSLKGGFEYNMSGLDLVYNGKTLVKIKDDENSGATNYDVGNKSIISRITSYRYVFKKSYKIKKIVAGSPADKAGLKMDDVIININGIEAYNFTLKELTGLLQEKNHKKISLKVVRGLEQLTFEFRLVKRI